MTAYVVVTLLLTTGRLVVEAARLALEIAKLLGARRRKRKGKPDRERPGS